MNRYGFYNIRLLLGWDLGSYFVAMTGLTIYVEKMTTKSTSAKFQFISYLGCIILRTKECRPM